MNGTDTGDDDDDFTPVDFMSIGVYLVINTDFLVEEQCMEKGLLRIRKL